MKKYLKELWKILLWYLIIILIGWIWFIVFANINWPESQPTWESEWWVFQTYFMNMIRDCPGDTLLKGFNNNFTKNCQ